MKFRHACIGFFPSLLLLAALASGQTRVGAGTTIGVDEIRPGMRGYGLTVFRGTEPERFEVEVIDVLHNFRPDQSLILARTDHPVLRRAHVVAGMSGSPIFLDGRLAGAYAYGWPYSEEQVVGITPIRNMLTELRRPIRPGSFPGAHPLGARTAQHSGRSRRLAGLPPFVGAADQAEGPLVPWRAHTERLPQPTLETRMRAAATPVMLGGFTEQAAAMLGDELRGLGMTVLEAGAGGDASGTARTSAARYVNGGAIGVQLVRGDVSATAVGTVTLVNGERLVAFGHPMANLGQSGMPTAVARVLHVFASAARSFKIAEPVRSLGTLVHDRQSGIVVDSDLQAATIPMRVRIRGVEGAPRTEWNMELASHRVMTPLLANAALRNALAASVSDQADVMIRATSRVHMAGASTPIEVQDRLFSQVGVANPLAFRNLRLFPLLQAVYGNPFEEARVDRLDVELELDFQRDVLQIVDASVASREVDPGSEIQLRVVTRRYNDSVEQVRVLPIRIPAALAGAALEVRVQSGADVQRTLAQPRRLADLIQGIQERYPRTSIVVSLKTPARGLRFSGHVVRSLPLSALDALQRRNDGDRARPFLTFRRHETPTEHVVAGTARVDLQVREQPRQL